MILRKIYYNYKRQSRISLWQFKQSVRNWLPYYLIFHPITFITDYKLTSFFHAFDEVFIHVLDLKYQLLHCIHYKTSLSFILMYNYMFTIGFASGDIAAYSIVLTLFWCFKTLHCLLRCLGSLYSCTTQSVLLESNNFSAGFSKHFW